MSPAGPPTLQRGHDQAGHRVRLDWGLTGARAIGTGADVAVVVDVLSFTTTLSVAVSRGVEVFPFRWRDERAEEYAAARDAVLAVGRREARAAAGGVSLSPASVAAAEGLRRLVLPSPNGSTISRALAGSGAQVVGAGLRNAGAVGRWLATRVEAGAVVAVVPAGEKWPDGSLRPAVEDLWGAGAVLTALRAETLSPEARVAREAFAAAADELPAHLAACASGVELVAGGFAADVEVAAEQDADDVVPELDGESFRAL